MAGHKGHVNAVLDAPAGLKFTVHTARCPHAGGGEPLAAGGSDLEQIGLVAPLVGGFVYSIWDGE